MQKSSISDILQGPINACSQQLLRQFHQSDIEVNKTRNLLIQLFLIKHSEPFRLWYLNLQIKIHWDCSKIDSALFLESAFTMVRGFTISYQSRQTWIWHKKVKSIGDSLSQYGAMTSMTVNVTNVPEFATLVVVLVEVPVL